jgi:hypothetical protein
MDSPDMVPPDMPLILSPIHHAILFRSSFQEPGFDKCQREFTASARPSQRRFQRFSRVIR